VHYKGNSWHQDLKPDNILFDDKENIVIIDWEQGIGGANRFISAREADGSLDLKVISGDGKYGNSRPIFCYIPYVGQVRTNNIMGIPKWDVFPDWHRINRLAVEAAEVFSLGATIFLLLEEIGYGDNLTRGLEAYCETRREWTERSRDITQQWKENINACTKDDPNKRPTLLEEREFWGRELELFDNVCIIKPI
jgi:serine/threonine protein kinase